MPQPKCPITLQASMVQRVAWSVDPSTGWIWWQLGRRLPRQGGYLQDGKRGECTIFFFEDFAPRQKQILASDGRGVNILGWLKHGQGALTNLPLQVVRVEDCQSVT